VSKSVVMAVPANVDLGPTMQPMRPDSVLSGKPESRSKVLVRSRDWTAHILIWECTAGRFNWHYEQDESVVVVSGEAFMINENGEERRFGAGDVGFFPAGTSCTWYVPNGFRKVALVREPLWYPLGFAVKAWNKLLRMAGLPHGPSPRPVSELKMRIEQL